MGRDEVSRSAPGTNTLGCNEYGTYDGTHGTQTVHNTAVQCAGLYMLDFDAGEMPLPPHIQRIFCDGGYCASTVGSHTSLSNGIYAVQRKRQS